MELRRVLPVLVVAGCGKVGAAPVDSTLGGGDAGPDGASGAVTITSISPADGATKVGVLSTVTVQLSGPVDASSVGRQSVVLTDGDSRRVIPASVSYDAATHAIALAPLTALTTGEKYKLSITGVTAGGAAVASATAHWTTVFNPTSYYVTLDATGKITSLVDYGNNADGTGAWWAAMGAGADGVFRTGDDVRTSYIAYAYPSATLIRRVQSSGAGSDGLWGTADDLIGSYNDTISDTPGPISSNTYQPGPDGKIGTSDDVASNFGTYAYDAMDRELRDIYGSPGADGKIGTSDDVIQNDYRYVYTGGGDYDYLGYSGPGPDGAWNTADDKITGYTQYHYDATGALMTLTFRGVGADGKPETADDPTTGRWVHERDSHGLSTRYVIYSGAGADNAWGTADDVVGSYYLYSFDAAGNLMEYAGYALGADGKPFTADDHKTYSELHDPTL